MGEWVEEDGRRTYYPSGKPKTVETGPREWQTDTGETFLMPRWWTPTGSEQATTTGGMTQVTQHTKTAKPTGHEVMTPQGGMTLTPQSAAKLSEQDQKMETYQKYGVYFIDVGKAKEESLRETGTFVMTRTPGGQVWKAGKEIHPSYGEMVLSYKPPTAETILESRQMRLLGMTSGEKAELGAPTPLTKDVLAPMMGRVGKMTGAERQFAELGAGAVMYIGTVAEMPAMLLRPSTQKLIYKTAVTPELWKYPAADLIKGTISTAKEHPAMLAGGLVLGGMLGKAAGILPKPQLVSIGGYRGIGIKWGSGLRAKPLIGISGKRPILGTPSIDVPSVVGTGGYAPLSPLESKIILNNIKKSYPSETYGLIKSYASGSQITEMQRSAFIRSLGMQTKTLGPSGIREVLKVTKKYGGELYGSFSAESQMPAGTMGRVPGDIDISFKRPQAETSMIASDLTKNLQKRGVTARISGSSPTLIETKVGGEWHHAVDIHSMEAPIKDIMTPGFEGAWGFRYNQPTIPLKSEVGKLNVMPLSEQALRKGGSSTTLRQVSPDYKFGIGPELHRMKDIGDYMTAQKVLIESRKLSLGLRGGIGTMKAERSLSEFQSLSKTMFGVSPSERITVKLYEPASFRPSPSAALSAPASWIPSISSRSSLTSRMSSLSMSRNTSRSMSISPSVSPSRNVSPSVSLSISPSMSPSLSPSISPSMSPSLSPSISPSVSLSISPSISPSLSPAISPKVSGPFSAPVSAPPLFPEFKSPRMPALVRSLWGRGTSYQPSLVGVLSGKTIGKMPKGLGGLGIRFPLRRRSKII